MILQNTNRTLWQTFLWPFLWLVISFLLTNGFDQPNHFLQRSIPTFVGMSMVVFINLKFLLPRLYFKKRVVEYFLASFILFFIIMFFLYSSIFPWHDLINPMREAGPPRDRIPMRRPRGFRFGLLYMIQFIPFFIALLGSTLMEVSRYASLKEKEAIQSDKEKLETELKFLRSQINPHFLFNVLNNIYTLTLIQSEKAPESLLRLSDMLRYMLYDSNEDTVPLSKEIDYIKNYITLQQLKTSQPLPVKVDLLANHPQIMVPPMLFIPFVENAFKHSNLEQDPKGFIEIKLFITDQKLHFQTRNRFPQRAFTKDKVGGIGLKNIKQRLQLLYPNQHELIIQSEDQVFSIELSLSIL